MRPSLVVDAIEAMFGPSRTELDSRYMSSTHAPEVRTLLAMIDEIPSELMTLGPATLLEFNRCRATLAFAAAIWEKGIGGFQPGQVGGKDPIERIRRLLATCPDEIPPEIELPFVTEIEVRNGIEELVKTAWTNYRVAEWAGATVFAGTAIEALLLWLVRRQQDGQTPIDPDQDPLNKLRFEDLVKRTEEGKWLNKSTIEQIRHGQAARNLIHPGRSIRLGKTCNRATSLTAFAAFYSLAEDLGKRLAAQGDLSPIE